MKKTILIALLIFVFGSCKPTIKHKIIGFYAIDEITYYQQNIRHELGVNIISFDESGICHLPSMRVISDIKAEEENGEWIINPKDSTINIIANHEVFSGKFKIYFEKDYEKKLLKIVLKGENTTLIASKGLADFDSNKDNW